HERIGTDETVRSDAGRWNGRTSDYKDDFGRSIYLCFLGLYCRMCNRTAVEQAPVRFPYYRTLSLCDMEFARNLFDCHYSVCYSGGGCRCVCSGKENQEYFCNRNYQ